MVWKDYIQFLQWILHNIIELQVGQADLIDFWNVCCDCVE